MNKSIHFNPKYINYRDDILGIIRNFKTSNGQTIKEHRNTIRIFGLENFDINIKSFGRPNFINGLIYSYFRPSKAKRSFSYANKLLDLDINTPIPICSYEFKKNGVLNDSFYVSKQLKFDFPISEVINNPNFPNRIKILNEFVLFTFKLHENGINFLDHSPGNTLVKVNNSKFLFYLVDLNRMRFEKMNFKSRIMNFRRLTNDKEVIQILSMEYAKLCDRNGNEVFNLMYKYSNQFLARRSFRKKIKNAFN